MSTMSYIKDRLDESTTRTNLAMAAVGVAGMCGVSISQETAMGMMSVVATVVGVLNFIVPDKKPRKTASTIPAEQGVQVPDIDEVEGDRTASPFFQSRGS